MVLGSTFEGIVTDLTSGGQGVVKHPSGYTVFVFGVWLHERAVFKISSKRGKVGFAQLVDLLEASPDRRAVPCQFHGSGAGSCGACPWMFVSYPAQLEAKELRVRSVLGRLNISENIQSIWPAEKELGYRNRAQLKTNGQKIGFVESQSNGLAPIDDCLVLDEHNRNVLAKLVEAMPRNDWKPHKKHTWTSLDIDESVDVDSVSVNKRLPFQQANTQQNVRMKQWLFGKTQHVDKQKSVLELFCGSGNFTSELSRLEFEKIYAVEGEQVALDRLEEKHFKNVQTLHADLFDEKAVRSLSKITKNCNVLVLDPPRAGFKLCELLLGKKSAINDVFYVSCDLATFARDIKVFIEKGFKVIELQPLDQFPQTPHVELLCHLAR